LAVLRLVAVLQQAEGLLAERPQVLVLMELLQRLLLQQV
jgi:hypothetical protein